MHIFLIPAVRGEKGGGGGEGGRGVVECDFSAQWGMHPEKIKKCQERKNIKSAKNVKKINKK